MATAISGVAGSNHVNEWMTHVLYSPATATDVEPSVIRAQRRAAIVHRKRARHTLSCRRSRRPASTLHAPPCSLNAATTEILYGG